MPQRGCPSFDANGEPPRDVRFGLCCHDAGQALGQPCPVRSHQIVAMVIEGVASLLLLTWTRAVSGSVRRFNGGVARQEAFFTPFRRVDDATVRTFDCPTLSRRMGVTRGVWLLCVVRLRCGSFVDDVECHGSHCCVKPSRVNPLCSVRCSLTPMLQESKLWPCVRFCVHYGCIDPRAWAACCRSPVVRYPAHVRVGMVHGMVLVGMCSPPAGFVSSACIIKPWVRGVAEA